MGSARGIANLKRNRKGCREGLDRADRFSRPDCEFITELTDKRICLWRAAHTGVVMAATTYLLETLRVIHRDTCSLD